MSKRERILTSAIELFFEFGFEKTKIIDIAIKAGVGKGTVYEYFKSKEELSLECLKYILEYYNKGFSKIMSSDKPLREKLSDYLTHTKDLFYKASLNINGASNMRPSHLEGTEKIMIKERDYINTLLGDVLNKAVLQKEVRSDINISTISFFVQISIMQMTFTETFFPSEPFSVDDIIDLIFNGIGI